MSGRKFEWQRAIRDPEHGLTIMDLVVLHTFATFADIDGRACPSVATLARAIETTERTVRKSFARAEALGWIAAPSDRPGGATTVWRELTTPVRTDTPTRVPSDRSTPVPGDTTPLSPGTDKEVVEAGRRRRARTGAGAGARPAASAAPSERKDGDEPVAFTEILDGFNGSQPVGKQRAMMLAAFVAAPDEFAEIVAQAQKGENPLGLLTAFIKRGAHLQLHGKRARKPKPSPPCPDCGVGAGLHRGLPHPREGNRVTDLRELFAPDVIAAIEAFVQAEVTSALAARDREPAKRWLTAAETGAYLGCSERAVYQRIRRGRIPEGAIRHQGRSLLIDRLTLDRAIDR